MKPSPARSFWIASAVLWGAVAVGTGLVVARDTGRLPHILPLLNLPLDEEGQLVLAIKERQSTQNGEDCLPPQKGDVALSLKPEDLAQRLEQATVLVLTENASGSGFFISHDHILTNRHVIEEQKDGRVLVTSKALGHVVVGKVIAITDKGEPGMPDFAVIEVPPIESAQPLTIGPVVQKLQRITVAGYPGLSMRSDPGFAKLYQGDLSAAPGLRLSEGSVSNILTSPYGLEEIDHSAEVFHGNSGGPLVDACARAVGINTFIAVDQSQSGRLNYALSATDFMKFLGSRNIAFKMEERPCS